MDEILGSIKLFPFNFIPNGYMHCDGRLLSINQYQALFALLGTTFGGDGNSTFALPDLKSSELPNIKYGIASVGIYPMRD